MTRQLVPLTAVFWIGATLLFSASRRVQRAPLVERLRPYEPSANAGVGRSGTISLASFRDLVGPLARIVGGRIAASLGVDEDLALRLRRVHSPMDPTAFRLRQAAWAGGGLLAGAAVAGTLDAPLPVLALFVVGAPLLCFLVLEQQLSTLSAQRQQRLVLELPVVAEQLGLLLGAGWSLGGALHRLADRGQGVAGEDLQRVVGRMRHGLDELAALREWADTAQVEAVHRLVAVLSLNREAGDLGRLISDEARAIRRDVQRSLIERMDRRSQQVWIPVTVAALVPGAVFIAIPFIHALRAFGAG